MDPITALGATIFVQALLAITCATAWLMTPRERVLRALAAFGFLALSLRDRLPQVLYLELGTGLNLAAMGVILAACGALGAYRPRLVEVVGGALLWLVACQFPAFDGSARAHVVLASVTSGVYAITAGIMLIRARERVRSRLPAVVAAFGLAALMLCRIVFVDRLPFPLGALGEPMVDRLGLGILLGSSICFSLVMSVALMAATRERAEMRQRRAAMSDGLTGVANRRAFLAEMRRQMRARAHRATPPLSLVIFDLDLFKQINDTMGHPVGDRVLVLFARTATSVLGAHTAFGRLGGEEFAALLHCDEATAAERAERVRAAFDAASQASLACRATVSAGVCGIPVPASLEHWLARTDFALYCAKRAGRNRVATPENVPPDGKPEREPHLRLVQGGARPNGVL